MRVPAPVVLVACGLVASPLLGLLYAGHIDVEGAVLRLLVCLAVCWIALQVVASLTLAGAQRPSAPAATPVTETVAADPPVQA